MVVLMCQSLAGGMVGPPPSDELREFGQWSVAAEVNYVIERELTCNADSTAIDGLVRVGLTVLDRVDLEVMGGITARDVDGGNFEYEDMGLSLIHI